MTPATSKSNSRASRSHRRRSHKAKHGNGLFPSSQAARLHKLRSRLAPSASSQAQPQIPLNSSFLMGLSLLETQDITPDSMAQLVHEPSHISSSKYPTHLHMSAPASEDSSIEPWLGGLALLDADDITVDTMANLVDGPPPPSHSTKLRMAHQLSSSPSHHTEHPSGQTWLPALALMDADDITPDAMASLIHGASNPGSSPQAPPRKAHRRRPSRRTRSRRALAVRQAQAQPRLEQDEDSGLSWLTALGCLDADEITPEAMEQLSGRPSTMKRRRWRKRPTKVTRLTRALGTKRLDVSKENVPL